MGCKKTFPPGSYAVFGQLSTPEYSEARCIIQSFNAVKSRWIVKLWDPRFNGKQILVREENINFDSYATPCDKLAPLPGHLRIAPSTAGGQGSGLFCLADWEPEMTIFEEKPFMIVANGGDSARFFQARWRLHHQVECDRGPSSPVLSAFHDLSDGGAPFVRDHWNEATSMYKQTLEAPGESKDENQHSPESKSSANDQIMRIASVYARWQANSHDYAVTQLDRSVLYRYVSRMQHSCDPNCSMQVDSDSGDVMVWANRRIEAGEELTNSYMGEQSGFHELDVHERREQLMVRGFVCACKRCVREGGEPKLRKPVPVKVTELT
jgi:hypothetical protein